MNGCIVTLRFQLLLLSLLLPVAASAGSTSGGEPHFAAERIAALAKNVERTLAASGARVAIISRVGRDPEDLPAGIDFTHVAFAVYSRITTAEGKTLNGYAIYNLYQEKDHADISTLEQDYPIDYFAPVFVLKSGVIIPKPAMQKRLLAVIMSDRYKHLHNPAYSVFANPLENRYQNCTGFVLNVVQSAIYDSDDPRVILANNRKYFEPQKVEIGGMRLLLARMFMDEVRTDDQEGPILTTTFSSIARYMEHYGLADRVTVVTDQ